MTNIQTRLTKISQSSDGRHRVMPDLAVIYADLMNWLTAGEIGLTFRQCFSREWRQSVSSTHVESGMCARESELFERVTRCFPAIQLTNYWWGGHDRPQGFLIRNTCGRLTPPDEWDEDDLVTLVLEHLCDDGSCGLMRERAAYLQPFLDVPLPRHSAKSVFDVVCFQRHCRAKRNNRWRDLAKAVQVIAGIGNPFLEPSPNEEPVGRFMRELGFSPYAVRYLIRQWREAQSCQQALSRTRYWLAARPEHWPTVFALWSACLRPA